MTKRKSSKPSRKLNYEPKTRSEADWGHISDMLVHFDGDFIEEFYINLGIPRSSFYDAVNKYSFMAEAHLIALERIGIRNERICRKHFLSMGSVIAASLPDYLPRWKTNKEWNAQLKNATDENNLEKIKELLLAAQKPL